MRRPKTSSKSHALGLALSLCVASLAASGCGSSSAINTRHEELGTLTGHSTYAFADVPALNDEGFTTGHLFNPIMQRRIRDELTRELARRGYAPSAPESASLLVTFSGGNRQELITQGKQEGPVVYGPAYTLDRGALVLHFLDPKTNTVLWRGWGDAVFKAGDDLDTKVRAAVREIMTTFPASQS